MKINFFLFVAAVLLFSTCKRGNEFDNLPPETRIFLDKIELSGADRLNSVVTMHWAGEDPDGYVKGYEISFDNLNWVFTNRQDSTFRFSISSGSDTMDMPFYVRAVDNKDQADKSPAFLSIPIRNTPPTINFDKTKLIPDTVYTVGAILWEASDLDGNQTLDSLFVKANEGNWLAIPKNTTFLCYVPENPKSGGSQNAKVYLGLNATLLSTRLTDLRLNQSNRLYLKARDNAGSFSKIDTSKAFFLKKQNADFLVIDEISTTSLPTPEEVYQPVFQQLNIAYDYYDISANEPLFWEPAMRLWLALYDRVFWFGEGKEYSKYGNQLYLEVAAAALQNYLNQGGKLLISTKFPARFNAAATAYESAIFSYSPFDSLSTAPGPNTVRIATDSAVFAVNAFAGAFPALKPSVFITAADPAHAKNPLQNMYHAQLNKGAGWYGPASVCGTTRYTNNKLNQVFFTVELHKLNGDPAAFKQFWQQLWQEWDW